MARGVKNVFSFAFRLGLVVIYIIYGLRGISSALKDILAIKGSIRDIQTARVMDYLHSSRYSRTDRFSKEIFQLGVIRQVTTSGTPSVLDQKTGEVLSENLKQGSYLLSSNIHHETPVEWININDTETSHGAWTNEPFGYWEYFSSIAEDGFQINFGFTDGLSFFNVTYEEAAEKLATKAVTIDEFLPESIRLTGKTFGALAYSEKQMDDGLLGTYAYRWLSNEFFGQFERQYAFSSSEPKPLNGDPHYSCELHQGVPFKRLWESKWTRSHFDPNIAKSLSPPEDEDWSIVCTIEGTYTYSNVKFFDGTGERGHRTHFGIIKTDGSLNLSTPNTILPAYEEDGNLLIG